MRWFVGIFSCRVGFVVTGVPAGFLYPALLEGALCAGWGECAAFTRLGVVRDLTASFEGEPALSVTGVRRLTTCGSRRDVG